MSYVLCPMFLPLSFLQRCAAVIFSPGEWVYLEQGLRREKAGDLPGAIASFTR